MTEDIQSSPSSWWSSIAVSTVYQATLLVLLLGAIAAHRGTLSWDYAREILVNWDARHYLRIAEFGYAAEGEHAPLIVFFPGFPFLIRLVSFITHDFVVAGLVLSSSFSIVAHAAFIQFAVRVTGSRAAGYRAAALFFCSPIAVVCTLLYTEPVYVCGLSLLMLALFQQNSFLALGGAVLCTLTRLVGVLADGPLFAFLVLKHRRSYGLLGFSLLVCGGSAILYPLINFQLFDDPLQFLTFQQEHWSKTSTNPIRQWWAIAGEVYRGVLPPDMWMRMDYITTLAVPLLLIGYLPFYIRGSATLPLSWWLWSAANWGVVASQTFWLSNSRYLLACLPLYIMIERLLPRNAFIFGFALGLSILVTLSAFLQAGTGGWLY